MGTSYVRFLNVPELAPRRTHDEFKRIGTAVATGIAKSETNGIKGLSCMIGFSNFDLGNGFALDWMHGVLLGVVPLMFDLWLGKRALVYDVTEIRHFKMLNPEQKKRT